MHWLIIYLIKCSLSLACLYLFYLLVLRPLTFYRWNRFYLLAYSVLSFFLPLLNVTPLVEQQGYEESGFVSAIPSIGSIAVVDGNEDTDDTGLIITSDNLMITLFVSGIVFMMFRLLLQWLSLQHQGKVL